MSAKTLPRAPDSLDPRLMPLASGQARAGSGARGACRGWRGPWPCPSLTPTQSGVTAPGPSCVALSSAVPGP